MDYLYGKLCKYVEEKHYQLPVASANTLGGVKANPRTEDDTQEVHIGSNGKLYTKPSDYELPIASYEELGGIKVGENLTIDENGVLSAQASIEIDEDFDENSKNALTNEKITKMFDCIMKTLSDYGLLCVAVDNDDVVFVDNDGYAFNISDILKAEV